MKTQTSGVGRDESFMMLPVVTILWGERIIECGRIDYKDRRMNGDEKYDAPKTKLPKDGTITWIYGEVKDDHVYGARNGNYYKYECRYYEGSGDRKWMEECDRNYLARLHLDGAKTDQERLDLDENRDYAAKAAEEVIKLPSEQLSNWLKSQKIRILIRQTVENSIIAIDLTDLQIPVNLFAETKSSDVKLRSITTKDLQELLHALKRNTSVTSFRVTNNREIKDDIIDSLKDLYVLGFFSSRKKPNTTLTTIDLSGTSVTENKVYKLEKTIEKQNLKINIVCSFKTRGTVEAERRLAEAKKKLETEQKAKENQEQEEKTRQDALQKAQEEKVLKEGKEKEAKEKAEREKIDTALMQRLLIEVNEQRAILDRLHNSRPESLLDANILEAKRTELKEILDSIPSATGKGLQLLQTNAKELKQVIENQVELQNNEAELKLIQAKYNDALKDYYYTMLILLTDCISACKGIHAKAGPAQTANAKMNLDDYVVAGIKTLGAQIPGVSALTGALTAGEQLLSTRSKLQQINKIVRFFPTTSDGDQFAECLARKLTLAQETALKAIPTHQVGIIRRAINAGKDIKCWITADDVNNPVRRLAKDQCEACLKLIVNEQFKAPASLCYIPQITVAILGSNQQQQNIVVVPTIASPLSLAIQTTTTLASAPAICSLAANTTGMFAAQSNSSLQTLTAAVATTMLADSIDAQALSSKLAKLITEQDQIKKNLAANEQLAKDASQKADKATKAVANLSGESGNSVQICALAKDQKKGTEINVEDLAKENCELKKQLIDLQQIMAQVLERIQSQENNNVYART